MGHNSKIGYPYLPAREPWRGRDVLQRAWRATLAGPRTTLAGTHWLKELGGRLTGTALWQSEKELGGRPWRGRQTTLRGTADDGDDPGGARNDGLYRRLALTMAGGSVDGRPWRGGVVALAKRAWRATLAGPADDPGGTAWRTTLAGTALWRSEKEVGGRPCRGRRTTLTGTADDRLQTGPAGANDGL